MVPLIGASMAVWTGDHSAGLHHPITVATVTFIVVALLMPGAKDVMIWKDA